MDGTLSCPRCERDVDDSLTWCPYCGAELRPTSGPSAAEDAGIPDDPAPAKPAPDGDDDLVAWVPERKDTVRAERRAPGEGPPREGDAVWVSEGIGSVLGATRSPSSSTRGVLVGLGVVLLIGAVVWFFFLRDDDRGALSLIDVSPGDCWNDPEGIEPDTELFSVPQVPCDEPHSNEVYAVIELAGGETAVYPGEAAVEFEAFRRCVEHFEPYVDAPFAQSPLEIYTLFPTAGSWAEGDRGVVCSVYRLDLEPMTGTIRDSGELLPSPAVDVGAVDDCAAVADRALATAQGYIDYFDSLTPEELEAVYDTTPEEMLPLIKSESVLVARAVELQCDLADLDAAFRAGAGSLTATTEFGSLIAQEIAATGFFGTG